MKEYSSYQLAFFDEIKKRSGNIALNAVAGSGKTTTSVDSMQYIPSIYSVQFCAFGRDIAAELRKRNLPSNCTIATYNAFGWKILREASPHQRLILDEKKTDKTLQHTVLQAKETDGESWKQFLRLRGPIRRLVSLGKGKILHELNPNVIEELIDHYRIDVPEDKEFNDIAARTYAASIGNKVVCDYDDQVFQVHFQNLDLPRYDYVFVDEFQDTNDMQAKLMQKIAEGGRFVGVGDPDQSIYGFRGATPDAFGKFVNDFQAKEMPLSICYRCPRLIVLEAKKIVPRIEPAPWAREGTLDSISTTQFKSMVRPGDFVLCRTVAPLVKRCLENIRDGIPARVLGREIGDQLEYIIDKVSQYSNFMRIEDFRDLLGEYVQRKLEYYSKMNMNALAEALDDKYQTILALGEGCKSVREIKCRINEVFTDATGNFIKYMSGHKSKGLECDFNVFILRPDLIPHPRSKGVAWMEEEERRLKYVMLTRAKNGLYFVNKEQGEK